MIIKLTLLGLCVSVINLLLRHTQSQFVIIINAAFALLVAVILFENAAESLMSLRDLLKISSGGYEGIKSMCKALMICIVTQITSDICKESGNETVSDLIELGGRVMLLIISLPYIEGIVKTALSFVG